MPGKAEQQQNRRAIRATPDNQINPAPCSEKLRIFYLLCVITARKEREAHTIGKQGFRSGPYMLFSCVRGSCRQ